MKIVKVEWDKFWTALGRDFYVDDTDMCPEDDSDLAPNDIIEITYGTLFWQGRGRMDPTNFVNHPAIKPSDIYNGDINIGILTVFRRWRKAQTTVSVSAEIPRGKEGEFKAAVKALGGKVHG